MSNNLAIKALNQYRKRDILTYLGLRYYLENVSARNSRWINEISARLTTDSKLPAYLKVFHFKDFSDGKYTLRDIYLPAPNEALSETALITEISKYKEFQPKSYVYSYRFSSEREKNGVFQPYFNGFKERHKHIAEACWKTESGSVLYSDIKKFYPNIQSNDALAIWEKVCSSSNIASRFHSLGLKILKNHNEVCDKDGTGKGLLTGPLFSHVIANLLLDEIDTRMNEVSNGRYWRYVDDVVFVGTDDEVNRWREDLQSLLDKLGLELHDGDKDFVVSCSDWLEGEGDFDNSLGNNWISFIADTKRFLLANPVKANELKEAFIKNHIRIPVVDYSNAVKESSYLERFQDWRRKYKWATKTVKKIDVDYLLRSARECEVQYKSKINNILDLERPESLYENKRLTPKLRYLAGRLLYLLDENDLITVSNRLIEFPELYLISKTMNAVATRNVTDILQMGANVTHMTAQLLRVDSSKVTIDITELPNNSVTEQSLAILEFNGIKHDVDIGKSELNSIAKAQNIKELMKSDNEFIREFACLHGIMSARHLKTLDSSFDRDEDLALDVLNQLQQSSHC